MFAAASRQLGDGLNNRPGCRPNLPVANEKGASVNINALSGEMSSRCVKLLEQRRLQNNPVVTYGKMLYGYDDEDNEAEDLLPNRKGISLVEQYFPIVTWLPRTDFETVRADLIAGLTVGVMVIPQSMSYASIAGLQYIYGMYSAFVPVLVYGLMGQSRQLAVGPVAMVSLLVEAGLRGQLTEEQCPGWSSGSELQQYEICKDEYANLAFLTAAMVGVLQMLASLLRLGFLVSFLGHPVTSGFTSGAAIIIGLSQLKYMLGFEIQKSQFVYVTVGQVIMNLGKTNWMTLFLGVVWLAYLICNKKLAQKHKDYEVLGIKPLGKLGPMGPLISCVAGTLLVMFCVPLQEQFHVKYVGDIPSGIMPLSLFNLPFASIPKVLPTALTACLIGYMESIAIGKNLAAKHNHELDPGQELLALGVSNLVGACFSCYPVTGSFSRSAVNNATGARSQLSGLITGGVMLATLMFLTPLFHYLPKFALAAIVMNSVLPLVAYEEAKNLWHTKRKDFVLWVVAFFGTLFLGVLMGIALAVLLSLIIVIYESVRPQISILWQITENGTTIYRNIKQESNGQFIESVFIARIGSSMYFANASFIKDMLLAYLSDLEHINPTEYLILEMTSVVSLDSTSTHVLHDLVADFRARNIQVAFTDLRKGEAAATTMWRAGLTKFIGQQWFFPNVDAAVRFCMQHRRAKKHYKGSFGEVEAATVTPGDGVQVLNDPDKDFTTFFVHLREDIPFIVNAFTRVFHDNKVRTKTVFIEPLEGSGTQGSSVQHKYYIQSVRTKGRLKDVEAHVLREDLMRVVSRCRQKLDAAPLGPSRSISDDAISLDSSHNFLRGISGGLGENQDPQSPRTATKVAELEVLLQAERERKATLQKEVHSIGRLIDAFAYERDDGAPNRISCNSSMVANTSMPVADGLSSIYPDQAAKAVPNAGDANACVLAEKPLATSDTSADELHASGDAFAADAGRGPIGASTDEAHVASGSSAVPKLCSSSAASHTANGAVKTVDAELDVEQGKKDMSTRADDVAKRDELVAPVVLGATTLTLGSSDPPRTHDIWAGAGVGGIEQQLNNADQSLSALRQRMNERRACLERVLLEVKTGSRGDHSLQIPSPRAPALVAAAAAAANSAAADAAAQRGVQAGAFRDQDVDSNPADCYEGQLFDSL